MEEITAWEKLMIFVIMFLVVGGNSLAMLGYTIWQNKKRNKKH